MTLFQCQKYQINGNNLLSEYKRILKSKIKDFYSSESGYIQENYSLKSLLDSVDRIIFDGRNISVYDLNSDRILRLLEFGSDKVRANHLLFDTRRLLERKLGVKHGV